MPKPAEFAVIALDVEDIGTLIAKNAIFPKPGLVAGRLGG
jgi:hypothetical protein